MVLKTFIARKSTASALAIGLVIGAGMLPATPLNAAPRAAAPDNALVMSVGASRVVNLTDVMSDVVVADPSIADVGVRSTKQIYIIGKKPGETTVFVTAKNGKVLYSGTVRVGNNLTSVDQMLKMAMPEANITVSTMNGMVLLTGTIKAPEDAAEAERLTSAFVGKDTTVVSRLRTATPLQVMLQVRIAEVSRSLTHQIGTNIQGFGDGNKVNGYVGRLTRPSLDSTLTKGTLVPGVLNPDGSFTPPYYSTPTMRDWTITQPTNSVNTFGFIAKLFGMDLAGALDAAESTGLATTLAQPNLTSLSGETASFLAGGEYPYQVSNGNQGNSIEFKQYGVQLAFTPTVLADGRISLRVRPTVSSLDFSINSSVPALKSRTVETTVELGSGQAFMVAGLLDSSTANNIDKLPGAGNLPVLGSLFKSRKFQRDETELVVVVTPYLVKPVNASDIMLPTDGFRNATELQGLLLQQGQDGKSGQKDPMPTLAPAQPLASAGGGSDKKSGKGARANKPSKPGAAAPGFSF